MQTPFRPIVRALTVVVLAALAGCASSRPEPKVAIDAAGYSSGFDAAREALRSAGFELDRVDAQAGTITSQPRASSGLATPWDTQQTGMMQELSDLVNQQRRRVRITFTSAGTDAPPAEGRPVEATVEVFVDRLQQPGLRVPAKAATLWSVARDPALAERGLGSGYQTPVNRDRELERRIADDIERRLKAAADGKAS
ncbi:MAG: hypothetical protein WCK33_11890 [Phycisphaerae bacterium]|jgi:hypothetical protein